MTMFFRCDVCTDEMATTESAPTLTVIVGGAEIMLQIRRTVDGVWNGGHLCDECMASALEEATVELRSPKPATR